MRVDVCFFGVGGWRGLVLSGVLLVSAGLAQAQSAPGTLVPTLGQLADAQARKARDEWMKAKLVDITESAPQAMSVAAAPPSPMPKREPIYGVEGIYGPAGDLRAELSIDGAALTVRAGERLGGGWVVQAIAHDGVMMVREPQVGNAHMLAPARKRKK